MGEIVERRQHRRLSHHFPAVLHPREKSNLLIEGVIKNLGRDGALIMTEDLQGARMNDKVVVTFFIPPSFSGQNATIGLQDVADIIRVDGESRGVALRFIKSIRQFQRIF